MKSMVLTPRTRSYVAIILWVLTCVLLNAVVSESTIRWDFTESQRHTLSSASLTILGEAEGPIEVRAFIPSDLPPKEKLLADSIRDSLSDYQAHSAVPFTVNILDPLDEELSEERRDALTEEAESYGLKRRMLEVIESDRRIQHSVWFDVVFLYQDRQVTMPRVTTDVDVEYAITRTLKTILTDGYRPPVIGFTVAHGEAPILQSPLRPRFEAMGELVGVPLDGHSIPPRVDVLVVLGPSKPFDERALYTIDQFLVRGGTVIMLLDYRQQSRQFPDLLLATAPGVSKLLSHYGVHIETDRSVVDRQNPANTMVITDPQAPPVQTAHPLYVYSQPAQDAHPVTRGITDIVTPLVSHIDLTNVQGKGLDAHPLLVTSNVSMRRAEIVKASAKAYDLANDDDIEGPATVGAIIRGHFKSAYTQETVPDAPKGSPFAPHVRDSPFLKQSEAEGRILLVTSGTRMLAALHNGQIFLENAVEWGVSEDALTALRSRRAETPRLEDTTAEQRHWIRAINLVGPCTLLFLFGFAFRIWRRRA